MGERGVCFCVVCGELCTFSSFFSQLTSCSIQSMRSYCVLLFAVLGCTAKPSYKSSAGSFSPTRLLFPLAGLKNWLTRRSSHASDALLAGCTTKRLDQNPPLASQITVQLFQWRYADVAHECEAFLGPNGYRYVQISPPHEHIQGPQWWTDYQPVSYRIASKRGSETEFDAMIDRCARAGVGVIADVVLNHMSAGSPTENHRGSGGSSYRKYEYPNLYMRKNFHQCRKRGTLEINNYMDRYEVQNCELVGLADLKTSQRQVQSALNEYLTRLVDKRVSGFRIDAAKHIPASDLLNILKLVPVRVVQEVMYAGGEPIRPEEYSPIGRVHIFQAAYDLKRMFLSDGIAYLGHPVPWGPQWGDGYLSSSHSQIFVTNWDLERNGHGLRITEKAGSYLLCQVFILTWGYGQVDVFSGYNFTNYDDGPEDPVAQCGRFGWRCEHRHPMVVGAIQLGTAAAGEPVQNVVTSGTQRLAYSRGSKVFVALNNADSDWTLQDVVVGLPMPTSPGGAYRNLLHPSANGQQVHLVLDPASGVTRLCPITIPPQSAIGIMVL